MAAPLTNFKANGEDLADIYVDRDTVLEKGELILSEDNFTQEGIEAVFTKSLWSWGNNNCGQLGLGNMIYHSSPVQVGSLTNWKSVSAGFNHTIATKTDGTLWSWGNNNCGQLGLGNLISRSSPVQVGSRTNWKSVSAGCTLFCIHTLATKTDGTLWSWGVGSDGRLGLGTVINHSSPVQVGSLTNWSSVSAGFNHTIATKTDGTLWSWGLSGFSGTLGLGNLISRSSPVQVGSLTNWSSVSAGNNHSLATKTDGTLWSWGTGATGRLGLGTVINHSSPVQVGSLTNWSSVSGANHSLAIKTDGTLWSWGTGATGRLGLGTVINHSSPVQVGSLTNWSSVSGANHSLAIKTDGTLWSWGTGATGRLGLGTVINHSSPVQVGSLTNWSSVSAGEVHSLARKA
jgi:alpha-tubulin suppressor-like RCC1 family protein